MVHGIPGQMVLHALSYKASSLSFGFPPTPSCTKRARVMSFHVLSGHAPRGTQTQGKHGLLERCRRVATPVCRPPEPRVVCRHLDQATCPAQRPLSSTCAGPWFIVAYSLRLQVGSRLPSDPHRFLSSLYPLIIGPSFPLKKTSAAVRDRGSCSLPSHCSPLSKLTLGPATQDFLFLAQTAARLAQKKISRRRNMTV